MPLIVLKKAYKIFSTEANPGNIGESKVLNVEIMNEDSSAREPL